MKKIPRWFKFESIIIVILLVLIYFVQSAITIVPGHENEVLKQFMVVYGVILVIWIISFIAVLTKKDKNFS